MKKITLSSENAPKAIGPYSAGLKVDNTIYLSGQLPLTADGNLVGEDIGEQTFQVFRNIEALLDEVGLDFRHIVKTTVFLTDLKDFELMNQIYGMYLSAPYPARSTIQVVALPRDVKVEIECVVRTDLVFDEQDVGPEHDCANCTDGTCCGCE